MTPFLYLTHPQVQVDPAVAVPEWSLSPAGRARAEAFARLPELRTYGRIVSSTETKAMETAGIIGAALGIPVAVRENLHENDRSATGYLPEVEFEVTADAFFAQPHDSVRGWETAAAAQTRIVTAVEAALAEAPETPTIVVGHGGVGTLLLCRLAGYGISRKYDQPPVGGGCWFRRTASETPRGWRVMEEGLAP